MNFLIENGSFSPRARFVSTRRLREDVKLEMEVSWHNAKSKKKK